MEIVLIPVENIIAENYHFSDVECDPDRRDRVESCFSSFWYYESIQEQLASIVVSLVKNHFFLDGNKRTALSTYLVLARANGLDHVKDDDALVELFVQIAASSKNMAEYAEMLFPG